MGINLVAPVAGAAAAPGARSGGGQAAPTMEEYRTVAILVLGLIVKIGLLAAALGLMARGGRAVWRRLQRGGRAMSRADFPSLLTGARLALAPLLGLLAWRRRGTPFCACLLAALGLDIADGVLARRFSPPVALARQRRWDGRVDAVIYLTAPWAIWRLRPGVARAQAGPLAALAGAHLLNLATGWARFGRLPRYHTRSFKLSAGALGLAVPTLFTRGVRSRPFRLALLAATAAHLENVAITLTLAEWRAPVPTLWHALHARPPADDERPLLAYADR